MREMDKLLLDAFQKTDIKAVCQLVRGGGNVDAQDEYGYSLLQKAIYLGNRNLFESLILLGADLNITSIRESFDFKPTLTKHTLFSGNSVSSTIEL